MARDISATWSTICAGVESVLLYSVLLGKAPHYIQGPCTEGKLFFFSPLILPGLQLGVHLSLIIGPGTPPFKDPDVSMSVLKLGLPGLFLIYTQWCSATSET